MRPLHAILRQASRLIVALAAGAAALSLGGSVRGQTTSSSKSKTAAPKQSRSGLEMLEQFHTPPRGPGESNHFIDLWPGLKIRDFARECGLTNNHALIVNSHGRAVGALLGSRYRFYPHDALLQPRQKRPYFSAADLARVLGPASTSRIHNILIGACNEEGAFSSRELRRHFVNATNITHMAEGERGYQPMFLQAIAGCSGQIEPLYETPVHTAGRAPEYQIGNEPRPGSTKLSPYVADLFLPGAKEPFQTRIAGREIIESPSSFSPAAISELPPSPPPANQPSFVNRR